MLYKYLVSKKGFTVTELFTVVMVIGILVGIAVPVFSGALKKQRKEDCNNQATVIQSLVQQAMIGMIDNGKKQEAMNTRTLPDSDPRKNHHTGNVNASFKVDSEHEYDYYFIFDETITLGFVRGGYRTIGTYPEYKDGCEYEKKYLKKKKLEDKCLYEYLDRNNFIEVKSETREFFRNLNNDSDPDNDIDMSIPVCPFIDVDEIVKTTTDSAEVRRKIRTYCVFEDGTVYCNCEECNKVD